MSALVATVGTEVELTEAREMPAMEDKREPLIDGDADTVPMVAIASEVVTTSRNKRAKPLTLLPLVALIFYDVSGGPFGIEVRYTP